MVCKVIGYGFSNVSGEHESRLSKALCPAEESQSWVKVDRGKLCKNTIFLTFWPPFPFLPLYTPRASSNHQFVLCIVKLVFLKKMFWESTYKTDREDLSFPGMTDHLWTQLGLNLKVVGENFSLGLPKFLIITIIIYISIIIIHQLLRSFPRQRRCLWQMITSLSTFLRNRNSVRQVICTKSPSFRASNISYFSIYTSSIS